MRILYILIGLLLHTCLMAQSSLNMELLDEQNLPSAVGGNDIWGYVDDEGNEYAIMGTTQGTNIYNVTDPYNTVLVSEIPGVESIWRDIKTYGHFAYVTSDEGNDGLLIIDLSGLPGSVTYRFWKPTLEVGEGSYNLRRCHNIYIDTNEGYAYLAGCNVSNRGVLILKLDEVGGDPVLEGAADLTYSHDAYVLDDRLYASEINIGRFGIYDITDKSNPVLIGSEETRRVFTHNAWASDDNMTLFTTDEKRGAYVESWDVSDPADIMKLGEFRPQETEQLGNVIPHNTHFYNNYIYTSWYTDGIIICDVTDPSVIVPVATYDTFTDNENGGFQGAWGAYPYLPSGNILVSDMQRGLLVFSTTDNSGNPGLPRASYFRGIVQDVLSKSPIVGAQLRFLGPKLNITTTDANGFFNTGYVYGGQQQIEVSAPGYPTDTISVGLSIFNPFRIVELGDLSRVGIVQDKEGLPVEGASIIIHNDVTGAQSSTTTGEDGNFTVSLLGASQYSLYVGKWGYKQKEIRLDSSVILEVVLEEAYEDDFFADLGWELTSEAESGNWNIGTPELDEFGTIEVETEGDSAYDIGDKAMMTEKNTGPLGAQDVDNGTTTISSPVMDWSAYTGAAIEMKYFYVGLVSDESLDDLFRISVSNGSERVELFSSLDITTGWTDLKLNVSPSDIAFTDEMTVSVSAEDLGNPHYIEAQFDQFKVYEAMPTSVNDEKWISLSVFPNPVTERLYIQVDDEVRFTSFHIINHLGQVIRSGYIDDVMEVNVLDLDTGNYYLRLEDYDGRSILKTFVKL